ncbi:MAG: DUF2066 domain-containing protein [Woeseiaceae bacterium]|nr:DUF2066 domain-containing protein [Woeseiaceae bacterium]
MTIDKSKRRRVRAFSAVAFRLLLLFMLTGGLMPVASAVEVAGLYSVEVTLDPDDPNAQSSAYQRALTEVLVRITGTMAAADAEELAILFPNPAVYVLQYRPGPDDALVVTLDGPAIQRTLRQAGATVWGTDRPLTIIWLAIDWGLGDREIVPAGDPDRGASGGRLIDRNQLLRERVQEIATRRGLPIVFPLLDAEDLRRIGFVDIWGGFDDPLLEASARYEADSILVGRIRPNEMQSPRWTWYVSEQRFGWPGEPEEAMHQLADALAARNAIRSDEVSEVLELTITGIDSVGAYGRVQQYMSNLRVIDSLVIRSAQPDRITYEVTVQGGAERLHNALGISNLLERVDDGYFIDGGAIRQRRQPMGSAQSFEYRYLRPEAPSVNRPPGYRDVNPEH